MTWIIGISRSHAHAHDVRHVASASRARSRDRSPTTNATPVSYPNTTPELLVAQGSHGAGGGFALAYLDREPDPWLESLHVIDRLRGRGAGTLLMRTLAAQLRDRGYNSMRLGVIVGNQDAARLYERLGAALVGVELVSWANGVRHQVFRWSDLGDLSGAPSD